MKKLIIITLIMTAIYADAISNASRDHIYEKGDKLIPFTLMTQHDQKRWLDDETALIFITYDKHSTALQNRFIRSKGGETFLTQNHTLLIVDVSVIPSGIRSLFVLPKLESFKHSLLLSYDENFSRMFPYKDQHIAIMKIKKRVVEKVLFCQDAPCLEKLYK